MFSTFDPLLFVRIVGSSFVGGYLVCLMFKEIFGYNVGRRKGPKP